MSSWCSPRPSKPLSVFNNAELGSIPRRSRKKTVIKSKVLIIKSHFLFFTTLSLKYKFIDEYFYLAPITLVVNFQTIVASYCFGAQSGMIEINFSKGLQLVSFISISTISIIFIYQNRNKNQLIGHALLLCFYFLC